MFDYNPYEALQGVKPVETFSLVSSDVRGDGALDRAQLGSSHGGLDRSPQLSWTGFPAATRSFAVTCFDPDAPSASGWWHWAVVNLSATQTSLPTDAGAAGGENLPEGALMLPNDDRERRYSGPTPPRGTGVHRYFFVVHALDLPRVDVSTDAALATLGMQLFFHGLGRGILVGTASGD